MTDKPFSVLWEVIGCGDEDFLVFGVNEIRDVIPGGIACLQRVTKCPEERRVSRQGPQDSVQAEHATIRCLECILVCMVRHPAGGPGIGGVVYRENVFKDMGDLTGMVGERIGPYFGD